MKSVIELEREELPGEIFEILVVILSALEESKRIKRKKRVGDESGEFEEKYLKEVEELNKQMDLQEIGL